MKERPSGVVRIFLYNRLTYLVTWGAAVLALAIGGLLPSPWAVLVLGGASAAIVWSLVSLGVSAYVYDHSPLVAGRWIAPLLPGAVMQWVSIHAGPDAEVDVTPVFARNMRGST